MKNIKSTFPPSELIINPDGSIYHLHLKPEDIADIIILVGDPHRVAVVSSFFDHIELKKQKREFFTHTGSMNGKRLSVISTGIGTDNIDIVLNELDALVNIDLERRELKSEHKTLQFIRIGTSGGIRPEIPVNTTIISEQAIGLDGLGQYYEHELSGLAQNFHTQITKKIGLSAPYAAHADPGLINLFPEYAKGITLTAAGFYGPQGRNIRLKNKIHDLFEKLNQFEYDNLRCTNLEMETAAIYLLANLLGHRAISFNAIIANRSTTEFSENPKQTVKKLIQSVLSTLITQ